MSSSERPCLINLLPTELLYRIFATIDDPKTLCRAEQTCHRWCSVIDSQALWRNLATKLSSARILPEKFNELGKGSLITGKYVVDEEGGRWNYLYRDLVRNIHSLNRIPSLDYHTYCRKQSDENPGVTAVDYVPEISQVTSCMLELSELPKDYPGSQDAYVTRKIDFTSSATEGMRLQSRPLLISKTPPFTDSLCPGETTFDETAWVYFADQLTCWPRPHSDIVFEASSAEQSEATIQRGVIRAGTEGIFAEGTWSWPEAKQNGDSLELPENESKIPSDKDESQPSSSEQKRPWKVFATKSRSSSSSGPDLSSSIITQVIASSANSSGPQGDKQAVETKSPIMEEVAMLARTSATQFAPADKKDPLVALPRPPGHVKWAAPIDTPRTLPHARRWDENKTIFGSYRRIFNLTPAKNPECSSLHVVESIINTLYGEIHSQAHSDPNLRISYQRVKGTFPDIVAAKVDRLALPPSQSIRRDENHPLEPVPLINQTWNLFGDAKWSLNSVRSLRESEALEVEDRPTVAGSSSEPWWMYETRFKTDDEEPPNIWENAHKWEYRSCGDYLIISDDIGMSGPCTISCFKAGYRNEKSSVDPKAYLRGAALRNYLAAGSSSDLIWQKSMRCPGYILDGPSASPVRALQHPSYPSSYPFYFLDNDGLALNSKVIVYATRKKVFFALDPGAVVISDASGQSLTCMEFHIIAIESGQTINILDLEHEIRVLAPFESWYGWTSFVISDTHLMATVGGHIHDGYYGAENQDDHVARTWTHGTRYGREEVFIWPLDLPDQNLSLAPEERKISPTGRLAIGFNKYRWWHRDRFLSLSRDGRFLVASSKYTAVVWDLWLGDSKGTIHYFDAQSNGLQGYDISKVADIAWNGMWLQYRDIVIDPNVKSITRANPNYEPELLRKVIFIPNTEVRLLLQGANYEFGKTEAGKIVVKELEAKMKRRYISRVDSDSSSDSDSWETDDNGQDGDYQDDDEDYDDYDSDGGGFRSHRFADDDDFDDDDDEEYDEDYGSDDDGDDGDDAMDGFSVQRVSQLGESREQTSNVRKRKLETTDTTTGETSAAAGPNSSRQAPVPIVGWDVEIAEDRGVAGWGTDDDAGRVDDSW